MKHETKFSNWIRQGGHSKFTVRLKSPLFLEKKFSVVPDRLLNSITDDALRLPVERLNSFLPDDSSINISGVDTSDLEAELATAVASRLSETGVPVDPIDPVIEAAIQRYAERLNGRFQQSGLGVTEYFWRSSDDDRVRSLHRQYDDQTFSWDSPPEADAITRVINRNTNSYDQRWENTQRFHRDGIFSNVCRFSVAAPRFEDQ